MKILFQGDSITDARRPRDIEGYLGCGYATMVAGVLGLEEPNKYEFINRGISGNRVVDVYARIKPDIINLKPDVMSILIGVNDVWHDLLENPMGASADKYFKVYCMLIEDVLEALPNIKIMIFEPFVLEGFETAEKIDYFREEVSKRAQMAKKVAERYNLPFIPLQEKFNELLKLAPSEYWLRDGVHPTAMGHEVIKNEWLKAFKKL